MCGSTWNVLFCLLLVEGVTIVAIPEKKKKRRLGKGLESLLSKPVEVSPPASIEKNSLNEIKKAVSRSSDLGTEIGVAEGLVYLNTDSIIPNPRQPRQVFEDEGLAALADSINRAGLMQPIVVRRSSADSNLYELVAGERRWRAAQIAGLQTLPSIVRDLDDKTSAEWALIENLQREDLNPIDRAEAFDRLVVDFSATQQEIATQLGIDRSSVSNFLRLNDLERSTKDAVRDGRLSMGHAKVILGIPDASTSKAISKKCAREQWSVRELERQIKKLSQGKQQKQSTESDPLSIYMDDLATQLGNHLGTKIKVTLGSKKGSGKLVIDFYSNEQFEGILDRFKFKPKS